MIILILYRDTHNGISTWSNTQFSTRWCCWKSMLWFTWPWKALSTNYIERWMWTYTTCWLHRQSKKRVKTKVILAVYFRFLTHMYVHRLQHNEGWSMIGIISCSYKYTGNPSVKKRLFFCVIIDPIFLFKSEENYQKFLIFWGKAKVFFFR